MIHVSPLSSWSGLKMKAKLCTSPNLVTSTGVLDKVSLAELGLDERFGRVDHVCCMALEGPGMDVLEGLRR